MSQLQFISAACGLADAATGASTLALARVCVSQVKFGGSSTQFCVTVARRRLPVCRVVAEMFVSVRQYDSWGVWPCRATGKGWGWPTSWPSPLPVCPLLRRAGPLSLSPHHGNEAGLPLVSLWTGSFPSVLWMVTSAWSWWGTLGVWVWIYDAGRKVGDSWVPHLADWEHTQGESLHLFPVPWSWSWVALRLPVLCGGSAVWICLCCPASFFPLHFLSLHLLPPPPPPPLYLWVFPYCSAWLSSGSFCGEEPHLCRSCVGWRCRLWCWHHWWVTRTILTGSSGWSCGTWQLLQLVRKQKKIITLEGILT